MVVVLARYSVPEWVRSIDDSGAVGGADSTGCRTQFRVERSQGREPPCVLQLLRPERHFRATRHGRHVAIWFSIQGS